MRDMSKKSISRAKLSEALLKFQTERIDELYQNIPEHEFSPEFELKMKRLINKVGKPYYPFIKTRARIVAVVAALIILLSATTVLASETLRKTVFDFFVNIYEEFSIVTVDETSNNHSTSPETIEVVYSPSIPAGYTLVENLKTDNLISHYYVRQDPFNEISVKQQTKLSFTPTIDTENVDTTNIELSNGMQGFYCTNKGVHLMVLHNADYAFLLTSQGDLEELIDIAESLSIK